MSEFHNFLIQQSAFCFAVGFLAVGLWPKNFGAFKSHDE